MKKEKHQFTISEALDLIVNKKHITKGITESMIREKWSEIMGKTISEHTTLLYVKDEILYLYFNSSIVKNECNYNKEKIVKLVNEGVGQNIIKEVIIK
jgi:predicted nucleic acid-binding Zn ribbon protein